MKCNHVEPGLVAYHFALTEDETRKEIEAHLLTCNACLRAFLDVKRAVETGEGGPRPSAASRSRLRSAVARELGVGARERAWSWWERPMAFAFAGSAVLAAMIAMRVVTSGPGSPPYALSSIHSGASPEAPLPKGEE